MGTCGNMSEFCNLVAALGGSARSRASKDLPIILFNRAWKNRPYRFLPHSRNPICTVTWGRHTYLSPTPTSALEISYLPPLHSYINASEKNNYGSPVPPCGRAAVLEVVRPRSRPRRGGERRRSRGAGGAGSCAPRRPGSFRFPRASLYGRLSSSWRFSFF